MGDDEGSRPTRRLPQPFEWLFRDRVSGGITIAQFPNVAIGVFLMAATAGRLLDDGGGGKAISQFVAGAALVWWSTDELVRGVNPWRRILGAVFLAVTTIGFVFG